MTELAGEAWKYRSSALPITVHGPYVRFQREFALCHTALQEAQKIQITMTKQWNAN